MTGHRLPDTKRGELPEGIEPGCYWKVLDESGQPYVVHEPTNLTGTEWMVVGPEPGLAVGRLSLHTGREEDDGTISVRPGDGSSNSILLIGHHGRTWHGYIEHGDWRRA